MFQRRLLFTLVSIFAGIVVTNCRTYTEVDFQIFSQTLNVEATMSKTKEFKTD